LLHALRKDARKAGVAASGGAAVSGPTTGGRVEVERRAPSKQPLERPAELHLTKRKRVQKALSRLIPADVFANKYRCSFLKKILNS
jgi:hypothetical protein